MEAIKDTILVTKSETGSYQSSWEEVFLFIQILCIDLPFFVYTWPRAFHIPLMPIWSRIESVLLVYVIINYYRHHEKGYKGTGINQLY